MTRFRRILPDRIVKKTTYYLIAGKEEKGYNVRYRTAVPRPVAGADRTGIRTESKSKGFPDKFRTEGTRREKKGVGGSRIGET